MKVRATIRIDLEDREKARAVAASLSVDDDEFISTLEGEGIITADIGSETVGSARRAADDWLACLMAIVRD